LPSGEQHVDYLGVEARLASFMVDPKRLGLNTELRKSDRAMLCLNDEACTNKLDNEDSRFNATTQMCSLHETPNAGQDAQPVRFFWDQLLFCWRTFFDLLLFLLFKVDFGAALTMELDSQRCVAIGISSKHWTSENTFHYTTYIRVSKYVDWILATIRNN
jgi:hypothetical protein